MHLHEHTARHAALALLAAVFNVLLTTYAGAQPAFNSYNGGCPGAAYRLKLIQDSLRGTWVASGDAVEFYDSTEHFLDRANNDREKECEACCRATWHYEATITFNGIDRFGNTTGHHRVASTNRSMIPDPAYMSRHNRVYGIDCGEIGNGGAGPVFMHLEIQVRNGYEAQTDGACALSSMTLTYDDGSAYRVDMLSPKLLRRQALNGSRDERLYHKQYSDLAP